MSSEWRTVRLSEVASEVTVGFVGTMANEYVDFGIPFLRSLNVGRLKIDTYDIRYISQDFHSRISKSRLRPGDVVIVRTGKPGTCAVIPEELPDSNCSDLVIVRCGAEILNRFLCYYVNSAASNHIAAHTVGAVQQHFNVASAKTMEIPLPPLGEQKAIAYILGTLDDKIELNRKTNETLEAMAKALFKSWFVDFDPVRAKAEGRPTGLPAEISDLFPDSFEDSELGEIPSGWSVGEIDQILNLQKDSLDPATAPDEVFDHYSIPAFDAGKYPAKELGSSIKSQKFLVADGDVLVSKLNPSTPRVWIPFASSGRRAICSTEFLVCRTSSIFGRAYAYCLASSDAIVEAMTGLAGGTSNSHQRIRPGDFLALPCCIGTEMVRSAFLNVVEPFLGKTLVLRAESRSLSTTRDALLPKLISGEIRIPDAEKMLEEVGI
jgi:type I restriction enzyme S subunit